MSTRAGRRPGRAWLVRIALAMASVLFALLGAEGVARLLWQPPEPAAPVAQPAAAPPQQAVDPELPVLHGLLDLARMDVEGIHKGVYFRSNSRRLRGPEYAREAAPGVLRIAITGDSVTMGSGVEESDAYSQVLERRLNEPARLESNGRRVEVINVGLDGVNALDAMVRLADVVDHYQPRVLVYGFTINDIEGRHYAKQPGREDDSAVFWEKARAAANSPSYLWRAVWPRWMHLWSKIFPPEHSYPRELELNYFDNPAAAADFAAALDRFAALSRQPEHCGLVLLHTHLDDLDWSHRYSEIYEHVARLAEERGLPVARSFDAFDGRDARSLWVGQFDPHPNREGHAILAEVLEAALLALPPACLEPAPPAAALAPSHEAH